MRIISGIHKGKRLMAPKHLPVRPTTDFAKEGLFNILNHRWRFSEISLLDLFSGTGNISYEFASRGCSDITSVDGHFGCVKYISKISEELHYNINAIKADVFKYTKTSPRSFDIIFADPPYDFTVEQLETLIADSFKNGLVSKDGNFILEHTKHTDVSAFERFTESRRYGGSVFSFFQ
ncbi:MAG: 16S rRNA (guanine966-N2)-methyltransferase [Patiriisocius sp.]|jgi:16S rRNA (guanine(966)-N(2))-methyltransferase RsmD